jgi:AcrR family transcriptional regulator
MTISQARDGAAAESTTRQAVYDEMVRSVYERGYHATSLRHVSKAVGIQMASIYYHFASKQDLLVEIMYRSMEDLTATVTEAVASAGPDPIERIEAAIAGHISFHTNRRFEAFVLDSELRSLEPEHRATIIEMRDRYEEIFAGLLHEGVRAGSVQVDDVSVTVKALMAMCTEVPVWYRPDGRLSLHEIVKIYTRLFRYGVSGEAPAGEAISDDRKV